MIPLQSLRKALQQQCAMSLSKKVHAMYVHAQLDIMCNFIMCVPFMQRNFFKSGNKSNTGPREPAKTCVCFPMEFGVCDKNNMKSLT